MLTPPMDQGPVELGGVVTITTQDRCKEAARCCWPAAHETEELRESLAAGGCSDEQLALATQVVSACVAACSCWPAQSDAGGLGDQEAEACSRLLDVCQLAAAACQQLAEACGADVQPQQPAPPPPPPRAGAAGRFARACLQLAHAVLCNAEVAGPLVGAGQHAAAADLAKAWVKHLVSALEALCARAPPQPASPIDGAPHEAADKEQGELCGALASACCLLLELALAATALVTGGGPPGAPREMCSLATLNLGWTSLGRLMSSPPPSARALGAAAAPPAAVRRAAGAALAQLVAAAAELRAPGQEGRLRVVRFWLGSALKVLGASPAAARGEAWAPLATAALALHASDRRGFELSEAAAAGAVRELLLPKLAAAMLAALNDEGAAPEEIERRLRGVAELAETGAISSSGVGSSGGEGGPDGLADTCGLLEQEGVGADLRVQAGVLLASSLLQHAPGMRPPLAEAAAGALLPWALRAAGAGAAGAALADHPEGLWRHARCAALSFLLGCAAAGPALQGAWRKGVLALQLMAVGPHPIAAHLAGDVLCGALRAAPPAALGAQLASALQLLDGLAAGEALAGACRLDARGPAWRVARHLAAMLRACGASPAAQQFVQQQLLGPPSPPSDACAAAALAARLHAARLCQLPPAAGVGRFLSACLDCAAARAQWAVGVLRQQGLGAAEQLLAEALLGWLLECAQLALHQLQGADAGGALAVQQQAAALALFALSLPGSSATPTLASGRNGPAPYVGPALRLLAVAGSSLQADALEGLLQPLDHLMQWARGQWPQQQQQQQQQQEEAASLLVEIAGVAGRLGGAHTQPQALFHALLSAPHWAVRAAALDALVLYSRTSAVHGTFLTLIPPAAMAGPAVSSPEFVAVFKAHMGRVTDEQAQRAHHDWLSGGGLEQLTAQLLPLAQPPPARAAPGGAGFGADGGGQAAALGPARAPFPEGVEPLLRTYAEQRAAAAAHASQLQRALAPLAAEAKAGVARVTQAVASAEAAVGQLLSAVRAAAPLSLEEQGAARAQAAALLADLASISSRVRGLRDGVEGLRGG